MNMIIEKGKTSDATISLTCVSLIVASEVFPFLHILFGKPKKKIPGKCKLFIVEWAE